MEIYIENIQKKIEINNDINDIIERTIKESLLLERGSLNYEVSVSIVDNDEIKKLNKEYRGIDQETDVLSFPIDDDFIMEGPLLLGDIIISGEKALEQAEEYNHSLYREISYLTAHSMLHLMGYDHMTDDEKSIMRQKEKEIMRRLEIFKDNRSD